MSSLPTLKVSSVYALHVSASRPGRMKHNSSGCPGGSSRRTYQRPRYGRVRLRGPARESCLSGTSVLGSPRRLRWSSAPPSGESIQTRLSAIALRVASTHRPENAAGRCPLGRPRQDAVPSATPRRSLRLRERRTVPPPEPCTWMCDLTKMSPMACGPAPFGANAPMRRGQVLWWSGPLGAATQRTLCRRGLTRWEDGGEAAGRRSAVLDLQ